VVRPIIEGKRQPAQTAARGAPETKAAAGRQAAPAAVAKPRQRPAAPSARPARAAPVVAPPEAAPAVRNVAVDAEFEGQRLDNFLLRELKGVPKTHVYRIIRSGEVRVNKGRASADTKLAAGDVVRVPPVRQAAPAAPAEAAPPREFPILFEDEHLLAIDKPAGTAVHGGSGVSFGVIEQLRRARPQQKYLELVHRLDRETSGILLLAKKRSALVALQDQFRARETGKTYAALVALQDQLRLHQGDKAIGKTYAALVIGAWPANRKVIDVALHKTLSDGGERRVRAVSDDHAAGRRSITLVKVKRALAGYTLLDVTIKTGRTHQIRVHLTHEGHPIVGDEKYGDFALNKALARQSGFQRMFLHAARLRFTHPASGEVIELSAPLPAECTALLDTLAALPAP